MSLELAADLPSVRGDRVQLQQVVLNLVLNGLEAMREPHAGDRTLVIRTARDGAAAVRVAVQDSGTGIDEKDIGPHVPAALHDQGRGTGHGPGHRAHHRRRARRRGWGPRTTRSGGATFHFTLPVGTERRAMTAVAPLVFVVDDDPSVRKSLTRLLASAGYTVEAFASAQEFLAREPHAGPCCLVLDVRMPGLTGLELQEALAADGPPDVHRLRHRPRRRPDERQGHEGAGRSIFSPSRSTSRISWPRFSGPWRRTSRIGPSEARLAEVRQRVEHADRARDRGVRPRRDGHAEQADRVPNSASARRRSRCTAPGSWRRCGPDRWPSWFGWPTRPA